MAGVYVGCSSTLGSPIRLDRGRWCFRDSVCEVAFGSSVSVKPDEAAKARKRMIRGVNMAFVGGFVSNAVMAVFVFLDFKSIACLCLCAVFFVWHIGC